ncbi:MAG: class I tRNA ligase family protein [Gemmatimonadales bacterium]
MAWLAEKGVAQAVVKYRLYDWCRPRAAAVAWGPPIPIIYQRRPRCRAGPGTGSAGPAARHIEDFRPDDSGTSPLARHKEWYHVPCPPCGRVGRRETDVLDTFLDSGWYFLRYVSSEFDDKPFDAERVKRWLPVDQYIGGNEHAVLHLLYSRFLTMVLHDRGQLPFEEPFRRFRAHGIIVKDGAKMSKSRGNVVVPDEYVARWGADTLRLFLMFIGPFEEGGDFRDAGLTGPRRFLDRLWDLVGQCTARTLTGEEIHRDIMVKWNATKKKVTGDLETLGYNTAIAAMMELLNAMREQLR